MNRDRPRGRFGGGKFNRSNSRSQDRSPVRRDGSGDRRKGQDGRWTENDSVGKPDLEEMEEILKKARKEKIENMVESNKDLLKDRTGF